MDFFVTGTQSVSLPSSKEKLAALYSTAIQLSLLLQKSSTYLIFHRRLVTSQKRAPLSWQYWTLEPQDIRNKSARQHHNKLIRR